MPHDIEAGRDVESSQESPGHHLERLVSRRRLPPANGRILLTEMKGQASTLVVSDNGIGLPQDIGPQNTASLGLELIYALARQLQAELQVTRDGGTSFHFKFPEPDHAPEERLTTARQS